MATPISQSDYEYFKSTPGYTVNADGSVSWAGATGYTNNRAADGTNYVTDSAGNRVDPNKVQDVNNANNGPIGNGGLLGLGSNPVEGVVDATLAIPGAVKDKLTGGDDGTAAADKAAINTAAHNLGQWDPNAPNTFDFGNQQGVATPVAAAPVVNAPGAVAPPSVDFDAGLIKAARQIGAAPQATAGSAGSMGVTASNVDVQTAAPVADISVGGAGRDAQLDAL